MPWSTLELDPAVATAKDVKRAYAKRLKTCRPDQDPEGFRKLHEAYISALGELQWREASPETSPQAEPELFPAEVVGSSPVSLDAPVSIPEPPAAAVSALPDLSPGLQAVTAVLDRLETALKNDEPGIADLVRQAEAVLYEHPSEAERWGELLNGLLAKYGTNAELRLKPEAMLFELEHGAAAGTIGIIDRLDRQGSAQGIANLATLLMQHKERIATTAGGYAATRLACAAAFWAKRPGDELANFAYEHLARGERDYHMHLIDRHRSMADLLSLVPDDLKSFWRQRLVQTVGREAWDDEESARALQWLQSSRARRSPAYDILRGIVPEDLAKSLPKWSTLRESGSASAPTRTPGPDRQSGSSVPHRSRTETDDMPDWEDVPAEQGGGSASAPSSEPAKRKTTASATELPKGRTAAVPAKRGDWMDEERDPRPNTRRPQRAAAVPSRSSGGGWSGPKWPFVALVVVILKLVVLMARCNGHG